MIVQLYIFLYVFRVSSSDWVSEWMTPVKDQLDKPAQRTNNGAGFKLYGDEDLQMVPVVQDSRESPASMRNDMLYRAANSDLSTANLKIKLENTLQSARVLAGTLKTQITALSSRETQLKDAISNGRFGVTTLTVSTIGKMPRSYIIRDGYWILCNGIIQYPVANQPTDLFNGLFSGPRCVGREISAKRDPCVFNSVIKYETIPTQRRLEYAEDDYLCLQTTFNNTLEQYMSVTKQLINETCKNGIVRSLADNALECGIRIMSEYTFYPHRSSSAAELPLEYCTEKDGSCKMIIAWHVSNSTIENFEFLKNEQNFKKYFIKSGGQYIEHVI